MADALIELGYEHKVLIINNICLDFSFLCHIFVVKSIKYDN